MTDLWTGEAFLHATEGRPIGDLPETIPGISIDTRTIRPGEAFFAIKGDSHDGHDFATLAARNGAGLIVAAEARLASLGRLQVPVLVVDDVLGALEKLGLAARARSKAKIIAVTGSVGKTSTKEALRHALAPSGKVHAAAASFNNHWGVPLTLALMPEDTDFAIFEIGMNHGGEIRPLVKMVRPDIAIITIIAAAHIGNFSGIDEIVAAKAEIFEGLEPGGHALLNRDDPQFTKLKKLAAKAGVSKIHGFGEHKKADYRLINCKLHPDCSTATASIDGMEVAFKIGTPGRHMVQNAMAVLGAAHLAGTDMAETALALASLNPEGGRGQRHRLILPEGEAILIDESYNANTASMRAALDMLARTETSGSGRRLAVLGDMLELGSFSEKLHIDLAEPVVEAETDLAFLAGPEIAVLEKALPAHIHVVHQSKADDLIDLVCGVVQAGDVIMVKSSKGIGLSRLVAALLDKYTADADSRSVK